MPTDNVPPYEGRSTGRSDELGDELTGTIDRQLDETKTGRPGATASPAEERPVSAQTATQADAATPLGVGTSTTRRGEDVVDEEGEGGRQTTGTQGESQRPVGTSTPRDSTGIDPQDTVGPAMPVGGSSAGS
jgi:hypothetical protein